MDEMVKYISPSSFYYWEKCPLRAVYARIYKDCQFFPTHPDADLGSLIHKFYEKKIEWKIDTEIAFENKWNEQVKTLNESYEKNELQKKYYPIQWYSKFYSVKKMYLKKNMLGKPRVGGKYKIVVSEKWISNDDIGGYTDMMLIDNNGKIKSIIDIKTGNIYDNINGNIQIKEAYCMQLALYAAIINSLQDSIPELFIENIKGELIQIKLSNEYISDVNALQRCNSRYS